MLRAASSATDPEPAAPLRSVGKEMPDFGGARAAAVIHRGDLLGALVVRRKAGDPLTATEEKLLADLASQASLVIRNVRLVEDLRASRQRIVAAQDERAKALERNIHDGAQQQLVSLAIKLGLLERTIGADDERARAMAGELEAEASEALDELRDLARGIYPPLLADKGLATALEAQARKAAVSVELTTNGIGRYPPEVEAAVYFCCLEALNNVSKYARPVCGGRPAGDPRGGDVRSCRRRGRLRPDHDRLRHRPPGHGRPARSDRRTARSHERSRGGHDDHGSGGGGRKGPVMKERTANRLSLGLLWTTIAFGSGFVVDISLGTAVTFGGGNRGSGAITLLVGLAGAAGAAGFPPRRAHGPPSAQPDWVGVPGHGPCGGHGVWDRHAPPAHARSNRPAAPARDHGCRLGEQHLVPRTGPSDPGHLPALPHRPGVIAALAVGDAALGGGRRHDPSLGRVAAGRGLRQPAS
jgi:hypothetical protein